MKPIDIVKTVVYKSITQKVERKRRGPKGYGLLRIIRLLLYAVLMSKTPPLFEWWIDSGV